MLTKQVKDFLDKNNVHYTTITHSPAYSAQDVAAVTHIPGKEVAKVVMLKVDGKMMMAVLPASFKIDFELLRMTLPATTVELATETEFINLFPECEPGAMPPFGNLYGIPVIAEDRLIEDKQIAFNAGSHREVMIMKFTDFQRLVKPEILSFTLIPHAVR